MHTFVGKSEKSELFEDLFQTSRKIHNQMTEVDKFKNFQSFMKKDALHIMKNISSPTEAILGGFLAVFFRKNERPQQYISSKNFCITHQTKNWWSSWWTPNTSQERIWDSRSCRHRKIHLCRNISTPEKIKEPGPLGQTHFWTDCHTLGTRLRAAWFGGCWRATSKHHEPIGHLEKHQKAETNMTPL